MSLTAISSDSLTTIFKCLGERDDTISLLRRTCYKMNKVAKNERFNRIYADTFRITCIPDEVPSVRIEIIGKTGYKTVYNDILKYETAEWPKMISEAVSKVRYIEELWLIGSDNFDHLISDLVGTSDQFCTLRKLNITFNGLIANAEKITKLLEIGRIDSIEFTFYTRVMPLNDSSCVEYEWCKSENTKPTNQESENKIRNSMNEHIQHLTHISLCIHDITSSCVGITNNSVDEWIKKVPEKISIHNIRTSFTFKAIWILIMIIVDTRDKRRRYSFGILQNIENREDLKCFVKAQREPGFEWENGFNNDNHDLIEYEVFFNDVKFSFSIDKLESVLSPLS